MFSKIFDAVCIMCYDQRVLLWENIKLEWTVPVYKFIMGNGRLLPHYDYIDIPCFNQRQNYTVAILNAIMKYDKYERLLILEDDFELTPGFNVKLNNIVTELEGVAFDMLYLGSDRSCATMYKVSPTIYQAQSLLCMHACILNRKARSTIFNNVIPHAVNGIDGQILDFIHELLRVYCVYPDLITQSVGYSYNDKKTFSREDSIRRNQYLCHKMSGVPLF